MDVRMAPVPGMVPIISVAIGMAPVPRTVPIISIVMGASPVPIRVPVIAVIPDARNDRCRIDSDRRCGDYGRGGDEDREPEP